MPKSTTRTPSGRLAPGQRGRDLDAEAVVALEDVADAGDQHGVMTGSPAAGTVRGSTSSGAK